MSEVLELTPGALVELKCPGQSVPKIEVGTVLKFTEAEKKQVQEVGYITRVDGASVWIGPLSAGEFVFEVPCSPEGSVSQKVKLTALEAEKLPEKETPLVPQTFSYPSWIWLAIFLVLAWLGYCAYWIYSKRKPKLKLSNAQNEKVKIDPEHDFRNLVQQLPRLKFVELDDPKELFKIYVAIYEKLRALLDAKLQLNASIETTREFLVTFRAAALKFKVPQALITQVEHILFKCDDVRFAGEVPPRGYREQALKGLEAIQNAFQSQATAGKKA